MQKITEYAYSEIAVKRNKTINFLINTNATLISEEIVELFRKYRFRVTVSIDGYREIHDENRIYHNGKGSFSMVTEKIGMLKNNNVTTNSCEAGRRSLTVDESGKYFACQNMIPYKHTTLGDVDANINDLKRRQFMSKDITAVSQCKNCSIRNLCLGGCEVERINSNNGSDKQMCDFFKMEWKNILYAYSRLMELKESEKNS